MHYSEFSSDKQVSRWFLLWGDEYLKRFFFKDNQVANGGYNLNLSGKG